MSQVSETKLSAAYGSGYLHESRKRTRLDLLSKDGEPMMTVAAEGDGKGLYAVKDYSENEGILDAMLEAGLVEKTGKVYLSGFEMLIEVKLIA